MINESYSRKVLYFISLPILLLLSFFEINFLNKEIKAEKKLTAATEKDLYLYKGMGASYLCIASNAGIEFPKALGVATATYVQVIEGKGDKLIVSPDFDVREGARFFRVIERP